MVIFGVENLEFYIITSLSLSIISIIAAIIFIMKGKKSRSQMIEWMNVLNNEFRKSQIRKAVGDPIPVTKRQKLDSEIEKRQKEIEQLIYEKESLNSEDSNIN